jgi:hypothetical protein
MVVRLQLEVNAGLQDRNREQKQFMPGWKTANRELSEGPGDANPRLIWILWNANMNWLGVSP